LVLGRGCSKLEYQDRSQFLERVVEMSILLIEIRIFWRSSGRRDVGDVGFGGWSWSDVAACT
jgi:hypothetical protein